VSSSHLRKRSGMHACAFTRMGACTVLILVLYVAICADILQTLHSGA
jgi:hypothetical protein